MCRLFGLHADRRVVTATFWLLEAPDNLVAQSKRNPDGTELGVFGPLRWRNGHRNCTQGCDFVGRTTVSAIATSPSGNPIERVGQQVGLLRDATLKV